MENNRQFEFPLIQYVPSAVGDSRMNIGVVLMDRGSATRTCCYSHFFADWDRVGDFDPFADIDVLEALVNELQAQLADPEHRDVTSIQLGNGCRMENRKVH